MENFFKVSARSRPSSVAGAISKSIRDGNGVILRAIGAGAVNQTVKALAMARVFLLPDSLDITFVPVFEDIDVEGSERTSMKFYVRRAGEPFPPATPIGRAEEPTGGQTGTGSDPDAQGGPPPAGGPIPPSR